MKPEKVQCGFADYVGLRGDSESGRVEAGNLNGWLKAKGGIALCRLPVSDELPNSNRRQSESARNGTGSLIRHSRAGGKPGEGRAADETRKLGARLRGHDGHRGCLLSHVVRDAPAM